MTSESYDIREWTLFMAGRTLVLDAPQHGGEVQIHSDRARFEAACTAGALAFSPLEALELLENPDADLVAIVAVKRCFGSDSRVQRSRTGRDDATERAPAAPGRAQRRHAPTTGRSPTERPAAPLKRQEAKKGKKDNGQQGTLPI